MTVQFQQIEYAGNTYIFVAAEDEVQHLALLRGDRGPLGLAHAAARRLVDEARQDRVAVDRETAVQRRVVQDLELAELVSERSVLSNAIARYTAGIDPEIARFLQTAAWNTVLEFQQPP